MDREFIAVSQAVPGSGFTVLCITGKDAVFSELNGIRLTTFLLLGLMLLLASDASSFISGQIIYLDGGLSAAQE